MNYSRQSLSLLRSHLLSPVVRMSSNSLPPPAKVFKDEGGTKVNNDGIDFWTTPSITIHR